MDPKQIDVRELVRLKIELELDGELDGESLPVSRQANDPEPLLLVSRHAAGRSLFFRHDVPVLLREQIQSLTEAQLDDQDGMQGLLAAVAPVTSVKRLCWYVVDRTPTIEEFPSVTRRNGRFVVVDGRKVASQAWADRNDERMEEVAVATVPAYRQKGYARQVVAAWMHDVRTHAKLGFYSHLASNEGSRALARSVGVTWLADELEYIHQP